MGAQAITKLLRGDWHGSYGLVPGPGHSAQDRSLKVTDKGNGDVILHSFAGDNWQVCRDFLRDLGLLPINSTHNDQAVSSNRPPKPAQPRPLAAPWQAFWRECLPISADSVAGRYLTNRGCALPPAESDLRWHPQARNWKVGSNWPTMVGLISDPVTNEPRSLHFTFLAEDGNGKAPIEQARLYLVGYSKRGICRLWPDCEVTAGLLVGEGIETTLTAARVFAPAWAALDAGNLASLPALAGIQSLTIAADDDNTGDQAADECAARWSHVGCNVRVWRLRDGQ